MFRVFKTLIVLILAVGLNGCVSPVEFIGDIASLSGLVDSKEERLASITWTPQKLMRNGETQIDGVFQDNGTLFQHFVPHTSTGIKFTIQHVRKIPSREVTIPRKWMKGQRVVPGEMVHFSDESEFYSQARTSLRQIGETLVVQLTDPAGLVYRQVTLELASPMLGIVNGMLILRESSAIGGSEGGLGLAYAVERRFQKLADGNLQVSVDHREWYYSHGRGFVGYGADNMASGTEPRREAKTMLFSSVQ